MAHTVKAYMSDTHKTRMDATLGLLPSLYESDARWLARTQCDEASRILADVEPAANQSLYHGAAALAICAKAPDASTGRRDRQAWSACDALAESIAAILPELDRLESASLRAAMMGADTQGQADVAVRLTLAQVNA